MKKHSKIYNKHLYILYINPLGTNTTAVFMSLFKRNKILQTQLKPPVYHSLFSSPAVFSEEAPVVSEFHAYLSRAYFILLYMCNSHK